MEVAAALAVSWQSAHHTPAEREHRALRIIASSFFALAAYVTFDAVTALAGVRHPEHTTVGIALTSASLMLMPFVSWAERRTGRELGSASVVADSKQTLLRTYLSAMVLGGLLLNSTLGWSWADPIAGLGIAVLAIGEGRSARRGDVCCAPPSQPLGSVDEHDQCCDH